MSTDQMYTADCFNIQQHCSAGLTHNTQQVVVGTHKVMNPQSSCRYCCLWIPLFIKIRGVPPIFD